MSKQCPVLLKRHVPLLVMKKNYQVEHYFPANFLCRVMKRQLSTVLGLVS